MRPALPVILLTSDELRHRFAARELARRLNLAGIVIEPKAPLPAASAPLPPEDEAILAEHFAERARAERKLLGAAVEFPDAPRLSVPAGGVNSSQVRDWIGRSAPGILILYGTGIIKPPLLDLYSGRILNLHLGLSPYYRGAATNFWPLVYGEPECVGATIHVAAASVDAGPILAQVRPRAEASDRAHDLGTRALVAALDVLPAALARYADGSLTPWPQNLSLGRVFRRRDFNAGAVRRMRSNFQSGMMAAYLADFPRRTGRYPIREAGIPQAL